MFDFAITKKGDLIFTQSQIKKKPLKVSFVVSESNVQKISFQIIDTQSEVQTPNGIKISFTMEETPRNKRAVILQDDSAKRQALKLRLSTALGQLKYRQAIGSTLESIRHRPIFDSATLNKAQGAIADAISDIITDVDIIVEPYVSKEYGYSQGLRLNIYQKGFLIFNQDMEV